MRILRSARVLAALLGVGALATAAAPAQAHHSFAMYDNDHQLKLLGTVSNFQWTNPHVYIELQTADAAVCSSI